MWALENATAYGAERGWTRAPEGHHLWLVAVKATFDVREGGALKLADTQPPPRIAPEFWGEPGLSSLRYEQEVTPVKPTTDVLVNGSAYAPAGRTATEVPVSLRFGRVRKDLVVTGPRVFFHQLGMLSRTPPQAFRSMPIRYENAYGGMDMEHPDPKRQRIEMRNPVGKGVAADASSLEHTQAYSVEYPNAAGPVPAGLGPIAPSWQPRLSYAGTYDDAWQRKRAPLLPTDYDPRYLMCAPADQQAPQHLRGGEVIDLVHLTPEGALRLTLPSIYLTFTTRFGRRREQHRARLGTVLIEPDEQRLSLIWNTQLAVGGPWVDYLDTTRIAEKPYLT